jgi:hypothetical protein
MGNIFKCHEIETTSSPQILLSTERNRTSVMIPRTIDRERRQQNSSPCPENIKRPSCNVIEKN